MLRRPFNDPLRAMLLSSPICHGVKSIGEPFVPITPDNRDRLLDRLTYDDQHIVCEACGSTKSEAYYKGIGAHTCCPNRKMVSAEIMIGELNRFRQEAEISPENLAGDYLDGVAAIVKFLGPGWTDRKVRGAREGNRLPIRQLGFDGKIYAFKSELTAKLKSVETLPK